MCILYNLWNYIPSLQVVLEKALKNGCNDLYEPCYTLHMHKL